MKNYIKIFMFVALSSLHLLSSSSVDRAIAYQHDQAGFSSADFDRAQDKNEKSKTPRTYSTFTQQPQLSIYPKVNGTFYGAVNPAIDKALTVKSSGLSAVQRDRLWDNAMRAQMEEQGIEDQELGQISEKSIEGLRWSQLDDDEQRIAYLKKELKGCKQADDINWPLLRWIILDFSDEECANFFDKIIQKKSKIIEMNDLNKAATFINRNKTNRSNLEFYLSQVTVEMLNWLNPRNKIFTTYHEAAHALMIGLKKTDWNILLLSVKPQGFSKGSVQPLHRFQTQTTFNALSIEHDQKIMNAKNEIMVMFAGGIGQELYNGEKLRFHDFLSSEEYNGIGSRTLVGTDVYFAYQAAEYYIANKDIHLIFDQDKLIDYNMMVDVDKEKAVDQFMEECYEQAYAILSSHKDMLDRIVTGVLQEDDASMSGDKIYSIIGKTRPKCEVEMSLIEKIEEALITWLAWTSKRVKYYQEQHPHD
ncbi:hypothetical protein KBC04_04425 [Candidatus Babeliales bacterium]|nr:hypothetical protein [Candidatus Babeliales bacterium]MBP9844312.1 hypothetical protein [Candidatus Babeliales bacterium]